MTRIAYRLFLFLGRYLDRLNQEDRRSNAHDWRYLPGDWDDYLPPYPEAQLVRAWDPPPDAAPISDGSRWEAEHA